MSLGQSMDDTPPEHSGFARFRDPALRIRRILRILPSPRWSKNFTDFFFLKRYWKRKFWARSARALHLFFLAISRARFARIVIHLMRGGGVYRRLLEYWRPRGLHLGVVRGLGWMSYRPWLFAILETTLQSFYIDSSGIIRKSRPRYRRMIFFSGVGDICGIHGVL